LAKRATMPLVLALVTTAPTWAQNSPTNQYLQIESSYDDCFE
jgi:hypothetical protein